MENSKNSMSKALSPNTNKTSGSHEEEESGWTMYFEDFFTNSTNGNTSCSSDHQSFSLVSDAASSVSKKFGYNYEQVMALSLNKSSKRLSFKKKKTKAPLLFDDALEDTASSPVNSPTVCNRDSLDLNPNGRDNIMDVSQEKGSNCGQVDERDEMGFTGRDSDCTKLKKMGLCLVPMSMVVNYFA